MSFTDNFNGAGSATNLESWTPSGGTGWTRTGGVAGSAQVQTNGTLTVTSGTTGIYLCDNQGSADHYVQCKSKHLGTAALNCYLSTRIAAGTDLVGWRIASASSTGRRLGKRVSGTNTDLITSQGVADEWIKVEASGTTFKLFQGGTGGSPSWTQVGTDQTVSDSVFTGVTATGIRVANNIGADWIDDFEAGVLGSGTSAIASTISASGDLTATIRGKGALAETSTGVGSVTAGLTAHGKLLVSCVGSSTIAATVGGKGALTASCAGAGTLVVTVAGAHSPIAAALAGSSSGTASLTGRAAAAFSVSGSASLQGALSGNALGIANLSGVATFAGLLQGKGALGCALVGTSMLSLTRSQNLSLTEDDISAIADAVWRHPWALTVGKFLALK